MLGALLWSPTRTIFPFCVSPVTALYDDNRQHSVRAQAAQQHAACMLVHSSGNFTQCRRVVWLLASLARMSPPCELLLILLHKHCVHLSITQMCTYMPQGHVFVWPIPVRMHALTQCFASSAIHACALALSGGRCRSVGPVASGAAHTCAPPVRQVTPCRFCVRFFSVRCGTSEVGRASCMACMIPFGRSGVLCMVVLLLLTSNGLIVSFYLIMRRCCCA